MRLVEQADVSAAYRLRTKGERAAHVVHRLREVADRTQPDLATWFERRGARVDRLWISNALVVRADDETLQLARLRPEVASIRPVGEIRLVDPAAPPDTPVGLPLTSIMEPLATEPGIREIGADDVWRMGYEGDGIVIAVTDTGAAFEHPALRDVYRGLDGEHDYDWFDAIAGSEEPIDEHGHGTHVTGTVVGKHGSRMIGVAPEARWISCRLIERQSGPDSAALACLQWVLAPTKLDGSEPRVDLAPDVVNASWGGDVGKECPGSPELADAVYNLQAAGILFVASAGNSGDACSTICAPGMYPAAFSVANYETRGNRIAGSSSRGPVDWDGDRIVKPEIAAPGTDINSSLPPARYGELTGTSMAAPHVTGAVALLLSARPELRGRPDVVRAILQQSAKYVRADRCGPEGEESGPNNSAGSGVVDIAAAVGVALTATVPPPPTATPTGAPTRTPRPTSTRTPSSLFATATGTPRIVSTPTATLGYRALLPALIRP